MDISSLKQTVVRKYFPRRSIAWLKRLYLALVPDPVRTRQFAPANGGRPTWVLPREAPPPASVCPHGLPIPPADMRVGYDQDDQDYLRYGERDVAAMRQALAQSGRELVPGDRILDLGCATARLTRHLREFALVGEVWGVDIWSDGVQWCQQNLHPPFNFATTTLLPHLPFEDHYFDAIIAGSVFTHIDDLAETWLLELRRVLRPGGRMCLTIQDRHSMELLETKYRDHTLAKMVTGYRQYRESRNTFGMMALERSRHSQVFFDLDFLRRRVAPLLEILTVVPEAYAYQTAIVLARADRPR